MSDCNSKLKNENIKLSISADEVVLKEWSGNSYSDMPSLINSLKEAKQFLNDFLTGFIETKTSMYEFL